MPVAREKERLSPKLRPAGCSSRFARVSHGPEMTAVGAFGVFGGIFGARCLGWFKNSASGDCSLASMEVSRQFLDILREHSALLSGGDLSGGKETRDRGAECGIRGAG